MAAECISDSGLFYDYRIMKVIFLDIDGVLNTYYTKKEVAGYTFVEDEKVALLQELVKRTGAKVVLSSTWREGWEIQETNEETPSRYAADVMLFNALKEKLTDYSIELLGYTPIFGKRGLEIDAWLNTWQGEPVERFVILDDMGGAELRPHSRYLIQTGMTQGLQKNHIEKAVRMLNNAN